MLLCMYSVTFITITVFPISKTAFYILIHTVVNVHIVQSTTLYSCAVNLNSLINYLIGIFNQEKSPFECTSYELKAPALRKHSTSSKI